ncbi:MAG: aminoglycoside phosphotransferase family protein [Anaerolineales bacterium]|nr:aminoglycoside phosphotransferase family protein [Anaerolineales bacterium]
MMLDFIQNLNLLISNLSYHGRNPIDWVLLSNGLTEFDENIIFFGFDKASSIPIFVAKVPRLPRNIAVIQTEHQRLSEIWDRLGEEKAQFVIPRPISLSKIQNQPILVTTYVNGESLVRLRITNDPKKFLEFSLKAAKTLRYVLDKTITQLQPNELIQSNFFRKVEKFKQMYPLKTLEIKAVDELRSEIESTETQASHRILIHGDYWHGNIILEPKFGNYMLVDWQYSCWTNDASQDVYLFLLAGSLATIPNAEDPQLRAKKASQALVDWKEIIKAYLSEFGTSNSYNLLSLRSGMLMCCIDKGVRASLELGFDREEDLVWFYFFRELLNLFDNHKLDTES